jgi:hypothetical protein
MNSRSTCRWVFCAWILCVRVQADPLGMVGNLGDYPMGRDGSGTSWVPDSTPMEGIHRASGDWMLMTHGTFVLADTQQGGPRGDHSTFSESMLMASARRDIDGAAVTARAMVSAEPINGPTGYPLLFQSGETANGRDPLVDHQHPHNAVMEIALTYSKTLMGIASAFVYAAPVGEPALGPSVFLHRRSSQVNPEAPLSHHHLDATHVTFGVLTGGLAVGAWKVDASVFNGREPDQHRYAVEWRGFDSWSTRLSFIPTPTVALQVSTARLASPESLQPNVAMRRTTASVEHETTLGAFNTSTTLAYGRNTPTVGAATDAWLVDSALRWSDRQVLYGRVERVGLDEIPGIAPLARPPTIVKESLGYQYDVAQWGPVRWAVGVVGSRFDVPTVLTHTYGVNPDSWTFYLRARLAP